MSRFSVNPQPSTSSGSKHAIKCLNWWIKQAVPYINENSNFKGMKQLRGGVKELLECDEWVIAKYLACFIRIFRPGMCETAPFDILERCKTVRGKSYRFLPPPKDIEFYKEGAFGTKCSQLIGGLNRMILDISHKKIEAAQNQNDVADKWRNPKTIDVRNNVYSIYRKTREIIADLLYDNQIYLENPNVDKETDSLSPSQIRKIYANIHLLTKNTTPMDLLSIIFSQIYLHRFHRGGKSIRKYDIRHFHLRKEGDHSRDIKIDYPKGLKNTRRKNKKNKHIKPIFAKKKTLFFNAIAHYVKRRGKHIESTAFFLQCHDTFKVCFCLFFINYKRYEALPSTA